MQHSRATPRLVFASLRSLRFASNAGKKCPRGSARRRARVRSALSELDALRGQRDHLALAFRVRPHRGVV